MWCSDCKYYAGLGINICFVGGNPDDNDGFCLTGEEKDDDEYNNVSK